MLRSLKTDTLSAIFPEVFFVPHTDSEPNYQLNMQLTSPRLNNNNLISLEGNVTMRLIRWQKTKNGRPTELEAVVSAEKVCLRDQTQQGRYFQVSLNSVTFFLFFLPHFWLLREHG